MAASAGLLVFIGLAVAANGCASAPAGTEAASPRAASTMLAPVASTAPSAAGADGITGFGATVAAWDATHRPDARYDPGSAFDPTPGLGPDERHDAKYFAVQAADRVTTYSMRLPRGSSLAEARAAALAELPPDGKALWTAARDTCAQLELRSQALANALGGTGMVFVEVSTETAAGDVGYSPKNANELFVTLGDYPKKADAPAC